MVAVQGVAGGRLGGGILTVLALVEDHRAAVEYDFRARFHVGWCDVGVSMSWGEAIRLLGLLRKDTSSQFAASMEGWEFPASREMLATLDLYDLQHYSKADPKRGKPKPHPGRPFRTNDKKRQRIGDAGGRSRAEVIRILRGLGHNLPV